MFDPIKASKAITEYYLRYVETSFFINDSEYFEIFKSKLRNEEYFYRGPYLEATDSFAKGSSIDGLIDDGVLSPFFRRLNISMTRPLYLHQERSIKCIGKGESAVITTGTGSGKTESFLLPILNYLFRELEQGRLGSGVRALLIYPMNALANDQMKRLRELLENLPEITFAAYTGETEPTQEKALAKYYKLNHCKPLKNELISREAIKNSPPHLLITNYAMLEYLMIRPDDNTLFSGSYGSNWKFIVLDEAHTYTGATGIEVAMLLKRLKARLETQNKIQYILTSATLGTSEADNEKVIHFADTLCTTDDFKNDSIIRAVRVKVSPDGAVYDFPHDMYGKLLECAEKYNSNDIFYDNAVGYFPALEKGDSLEATVFELLSKDSFYYRMKAILNDRAVSVSDITDELDISQPDLAVFISLASKGRKNDIALLDVRYHYFLRSPEGAYLTLSPQKNMFIEPRKEYNGSKTFKFSVCSECGEIYIDGYSHRPEGSRVTYFSCSEPIEQNSRLKQEYYLLNGKKMHENTDSLYTLCGKCGAVCRTHDTKFSEKMCNCGSQYHHEIFKLPNDIMKAIPFTGKYRVHRCVCCDAAARNNSVLRDFLMGQAAAASVIGTSLYTQLPSKKVSVHTVQVEPDDDDIFGFSDISDSVKVSETTENLKKQYLIFSDSRQDAAYFASYFDVTYHNLLRRRILLDVLRERAEEYRGGVSPVTLCRHLEAAFSRYDIFSSDRRKEEALKTILYEMTSNDRNTLEGLGILSFAYKHKVPELKIFKNGETQAVINILADGFRKKGAIRYDSICQLSAEDKEFFQFSEYDPVICFSAESIGRRYSSKSAWLPALNHRNTRADFLMRLSKKIFAGEWDQDTINKFLKLVWEKFFRNNDSIVTDDNSGYRMPVEEYTIFSSFSDELPVYVCSKCGKITRNTAGNVCAEYRCNGELVPFDMDSLENNHYYRVYSELDISDLVVKEHTAQLDLETAKKYQDGFVNKDINILSCSTTFEMGVDVGDLETVFMKNMPPTPANYIQRAGRAGRRTDSAAYALTFCKLSSHDLNFFRNPEKMIKGHILPPYFEVRNEKIIKRHVNACCFSEFFRLYNESFSTIDTFFFGGYYELFRGFISERGKPLLDSVYSSTPLEMHRYIGNWLDELVSSDGALSRAYNEVKDDIAALEHDVREYRKNKDAASDHMAGNLQYTIDTIKETNILTFLSRKSVLPKYGFPVDSVELHTDAGSKDFRKTSKLRLSRDMSMAVAEYAPDSEVIADGKIYKSRYIKLPPRQNRKLLSYDFSICSNPDCGCVSTSLTRKVSMGENCSICGSETEKSGTFVIPEYGFIAERTVKKATTRKPERTYRGDVHYIGNKEGLTEKYDLNGVEITVTKTTDDELLIMNSTGFYICEKCGYSYRKKASALDEETQISEKTHFKPNGRTCECKRYSKKYLGHVLKTDVAIISFSTPFEPGQEFSVLYALLEGISSYYSIERSDISGCLHRSQNNRRTFVLYDTVPGGAGHVANIGKGGGDVIRNILREAYRIVAECTCGGENGDGACYSCLCNYENQRLHDHLNRGKAKKYFETILNNH